jgi:hypothetical protein
VNARAAAAVRVIDPAVLERFADDLADAASEGGYHLTPEHIEAAFLRAVDTGFFGPDPQAAASPDALYGADAGHVPHEQIPEHRPTEQEWQQQLEASYPGYAQQRQQHAAERQSAAIYQEVTERLGRAPTHREIAAVEDRLTRHVAMTGIAPDAHDVAEAVKAAGVKPFGEMNAREQAAAMAERVREQSAPPPDLEFNMVPSGRIDRPAYEPDWDSMSRGDQARLMLAQMHGAQIEVEHDHTTLDAGNDPGHWEPSADDYNPGAWDSE